MLERNRIIHPGDIRRAEFRARLPAALLLAAGLILSAGAAEAQVPTVWGGASPENIKAGDGKVTLSWGSGGAAYCEFQGATIPTGGSVEAGPHAAGDHSVTFTCFARDGSTSHTISWTAWPPPTLDSFSLGANTIYDNESVTASWSSTSANACHPSSGGGALSPNSSATFPVGSFSPGTVSG